MVSVDSNPASALRSRFVAAHSKIAVTLQLCDAAKQVFGSLFERE
jgi:hypothetical protein